MISFTYKGKRYTTKKWVDNTIFTIGFILLLMIASIDNISIVR